MNEESVGSAKGFKAAVETFDQISNVRNVAGKAVCKTLTAQNRQGTGGFYEVADSRGGKHFLIITCNHNISTRDEIQPADTVPVSGYSANGKHNSGEG